MGYDGNSGLIGTLRKVVKKLRTSNILRHFTEKNAKKPILDVDTRWGSTYDMIERALELKDIIQDLGSINKDLKLTGN